MKHKDKLLHFLACLFAALLSPTFAIGLAVGKEFADYINPSNKWCWWDMLFNILGIIAGTLARCIILLYL